MPYVVVEKIRMSETSARKRNKAAQQQKMRVFASRLGRWRDRDRRTRWLYTFLWHTS